MEPVKQVPSRGTNLQQAFNSPTTAAPAKGPVVQVDLGPVDWLQYGGKPFGTDLSALLDAVTLLDCKILYSQACFLSPRETMEMCLTASLCYSMCGQLWCIVTCAFYHGVLLIVAWSWHCRYCITELQLNKI